MVYNEVITNVEIDLTKVEVIDIPKPKQTKSVVPTTEKQNIVPDEGKELAEVVVEGVTSAIDENIKPENIKLGATILGVEGNVAQDKPDQEKTIYPSEDEQIVVGDTGFELAKVIAKPVETEELHITPTSEEQVIMPSAGKYIKKVTVDAVENIEPEISEQESLLVDLDAQVNEFSDKPRDMLQQRIDSNNSCEYLFYKYAGTNVDFISGLDTSEVTNMDYMFYECKNLSTIPHLDTSKVASMRYMFYMCDKLTTLPSLNTSNVTTMDSMFYNSGILVADFSEWDMSKVSVTRYMFHYCDTLKTVTNLNMLLLTEVDSMFGYCSSLENLKLKNIKKSLSLYSCTKLTNDSLINTIQELWDFTGSSSQKLTLNSTIKTNIANIYVKLIDVTDEMLAEDEYIANKKPCVVCESVDTGAMTLTEYAISKNWVIA